MTQGVGLHMKRGRLSRYVNGAWIVEFKEDQPLKKEKKKENKMVRHVLKPKMSLFQKIENWLQKRAYWMNIVFAVAFGVSLALNIFQYKVIQFYKKMNETIIINGGF